MVHNGIEYGLMQAYAEGFVILRNAGSADLDAGLRYDLDCRDIAESGGAARWCRRGCWI
jgi:6-phosphogluconate dehydrogenase